tara:strand:- start:28 stop:165 length:138 start_codon:yes stop_codon:yes gene_type:complete
MAVVVLSFIGSLAGAWIIDLAHNSASGGAQVVPQASSADGAKTAQ